MARVFPEGPGKLGTKKRVSFGSTHGSMVETLIIDDMPKEEKNFYQDTLLQRNNMYTVNGGDKNTGMNNPPEIHVTFANNNNVEELDSSTTTTTRESSKKREIRTAVITEFTDDDSQIDEEGTRTILSTTTVTEISNKNDTDHLSNTHDDPSHMTSPTSADVTASSVTGDTFNVTPDVQSPSSPTSSLTSSTPSVKKPGPPIIRLQRSPSTDSHENPFTADGELSKKAEYILRHSTISRSEIRISDPDLSKSSLDKSDVPTEQSPLVQEEAAQNACSPEEVKLKENGKVEQQALTPDTVQAEVATANASQPQPQQAEQVKLKEPKCKCCVIM